MTNENGQGRTRTDKDGQGRTRTDKDGQGRTRMDKDGQVPIRKTRKEETEMTDKAKKFRCKRCREMWVTENYSVLRERTMDIWDKEIPREIIRNIAAVREYGTRKYKDPENWRRVEEERFRNAAFRHFLAFLDEPEGADEESGLPHLWHLACNIAFLCEKEKERGTWTGKNF